MTLKQITDLSYDELRIKVAELLGWNHVQWDGPDIPQSHAWWEPGNDGTKGMAMEFNQIPNWPCDLNACHKMERTLMDDDKWDKYVDALLQVLANQGGYAACEWLAYTPARQRCEAFILIMEGDKK